MIDRTISRISGALGLPIPIGPSLVGLEPPYSKPGSLAAQRSLQVKLYFGDAWSVDGLHRCQSAIEENVHRARDLERTCVIMNVDQRIIERVVGGCRSRFRIKVSVSLVSERRIERIKLGPAGQARYE